MISTASPRFGAISLTIPTYMQHGLRKLEDGVGRLAKENGCDSIRFYMITGVSHHEEMRYDSKGNMSMPRRLFKQTNAPMQIFIEALNCDKETSRKMDEQFFALIRNHLKTYLRNTRFDRTRLPKTLPPHGFTHRSREYTLQYHG